MCTCVDAAESRRPVDGTELEVDKHAASMSQQTHSDLKGITLGENFSPRKRFLIHILDLILT